MSLETARIPFEVFFGIVLKVRHVKVQCGREGSCCLECSAWFAVGKNWINHILYFVHWWAASSQLLPVQVCKKITVQEACIRREGRSCCMTWSNLTFHLWIAPPSAKKTLLLTAESSAKFFHLTCSRASLKHFLPWVLPLQPCREQTDPHESIEAQFLLKGALDAAQPTSITLQPALPGSCSSLPWLSCGSSCRFWEDECAEGVCCSSLVYVLLGLNAVFWHNWLLLIVLGSWDAGSASTWLNKDIIMSRSFLHK